MPTFSYQKNGATMWAIRLKRRRGVHELQRERRGFKSEVEARRAEVKLGKDILEELFRQDQNGFSLQDLLNDYEIALRSGLVNSRPVQQTTIQDNVRCIDLHANHLLPRAAKHITRADILSIVRIMADAGKSTSRQRHFVGAVNGLYRWAMDYRLDAGLTTSPALGIAISRKEERKQPILTRSEIVKLLEAARSYQHPWYKIWLGALLTGMRSGELMALKFADIDFENKKLTISKTYNGRIKGMKCTKGGYWREVPINSDLESLLKELRAASGGREFVFPRLPGWERGEQAKILRAFCLGTGIPSVNFHALRACFATQLLRDRVPAAVVMKICGWTELKTMQRYIRLAGIEIEGATESLKLITPEEAMGRVVPIFGR